MNILTPMSGYAGERIGKFRARTSPRVGRERRTPQKWVTCLVAVFAVAASTLAFAPPLASRCATNQRRQSRCICHLSTVESER